jgi:thioredoxin-related protein
MGVNGAAKQLRQLYARTGVKFPAFIVSNRMMADIGDVPATPITVLLDEAGHAISAVRGYQSLDKLQTILQQSAAETFDYCL